MLESTVPFVLTLMIWAFIPLSPLTRNVHCQEPTSVSISDPPTFFFEQSRNYQMFIVVTQASFVPFRHGKALSSLLGNDKLRVITLLTRAAPLPPSPRLGEYAYAYCHYRAWSGLAFSLPDYSYLPRLSKPPKIAPL